MALEPSCWDLWPHTHTHKLVNTGKRGPPIVPLLFFSQHLSYVLYTFGKRGLFSNWGPYCSFCYKSPVWMPKQTHTHRPSHAVLWGLSIVLSFVLLLPNTPWLCARKCYGDIKMSPQLRWSHTLTQLWGHPCPHNSATARAHPHTGLRPVSHWIIEVKMAPTKKGVGSSPEPPNPRTPEPPNPRTPEPPNPRIRFVTRLPLPYQ